MTLAVFATSLVAGAAVFLFPHVPLEHRAAYDLETEHFPDFTTAPPAETTAESMTRSDLLVRQPRELDSAESPLINAHATAPSAETAFLPARHGTIRDSHVEPVNFEAPANSAATRGAWLTGTIETDDASYAGAPVLRNPQPKRR
jgi:hypothetical protein